MCVRCGIGNIKEGIVVRNWTLIGGDMTINHFPCDCPKGKELKAKLIAKNIITGDVKVWFTPEEAARC